MHQKIQEMQFPQNHVCDAIAACGCNTQACVDYCLRLAQDATGQPVSDSAEACVTEAIRLQDARHDMLPPFFATQNVDFASP